MAIPRETDFVVVGAGVAGLRAAIELAEAGRVLVLTKKAAAEADALGVQAVAALSDEDEIILHLQDTLNAGDGLCNADAVKLLIEEAPHRIEELLAWGTHFFHKENKLVFSLESAHSRSRSLHAQGESTGKEILRTLAAKARSIKAITIVPSVFTTALLGDSARITGVSLIDEKGVPAEVTCSAVLLATGSMGQVYRNTTNPELATADGLALAFRAGAVVSDMEFVQFYPTALYLKKAPRLLLAESLRREGGLLRNIELDRFMTKYHPMAELAPADLVARAIVHEMEVSRSKDPFVYLDLTHVSAAKIQKRFPRIHATCMKHNIDITEDMIPIRPAAHFSLGGVRTDLSGKSSVPGLYAAGEVAATGVHGANRLASNSLLESLVYGARAGAAMRAELRTPTTVKTPPQAAYSNGPVEVGVEEAIGQIQDLMWAEVGCVRTRLGMQKAVQILEEMSPKLANAKTRRGHEAANLRLAAWLIARSALAREESRGAHYRIDYPDHNDKRFLRHSAVRAEKVEFV